jgi:hypothetical protein
MHTDAERTERTLLPEVVAEVIERNQARRRGRRTVWRAHVRTAQAWRDGYERMAAAAATRPPASTSPPPGLSCEATESAGHRQS